MQETLIEKITTAYNAHVDTINSIMHDSVEPGLTTEVEAACENFQRTLEEFDSSETDVEEYIKKLDALEFSEKEFATLVDALYNHDDFDKELMLEKIEEDEVADWLAEKGYVCVKLQTMVHVDKLKTFIETEIYPAVNDQTGLLHYS